MKAANEENRRNATLSAVPSCAPTHIRKIDGCAANLVWLESDMFDSHVSPTKPATGFDPQEEFMTPEERNVIGGIFDRLREAAYQPRDPEAERFIADRLREQPYAPYAMAQSIYVQEQALGNLSQQVEQLQAEVARLRQAGQQQAPAQSGGFLSGIFGGGSSRPASVPSFGQPQRAAQGQPAYSAPPQQGSPWGQQPQQGGYAPQQGGYAPPQQAAAPQRGGMGFLGTAAMTAAGVAGGMIAGNALMNAFNSHGGASGIANSLGFGGDKSGQSASTSGDQSGSNYDSTAGYEDPSQNGGNDNASYDNASYEDEGGGGFDGGGGDSDWT